MPPRPHDASATPSGSWRTWCAEVRPTTGLVAQAVFNILRPWGVVPQGGFLDLFAGSGRMTELAVKEGTPYALAVEGHPQRAEALKKRFARAPHVKTQCANTLGLLAHPNPYGQPYQVAYVDPPYDMPLAPLVLLTLLVQGNWWPAPTGGVLVWECASTRLDALVEAAQAWAQVQESTIRFSLERKLQYGDTGLFFLEALL